MSKELQRIKQQEVTTPDVGVVEDSTSDSSLPQTTEVQEPGSS